MKNKNEDMKINELTMENIEDNIEFISRLACLIDGVNLAHKTAQRLGIDTDTSDSWIKPIAFQKYIDERQGDMKYNIEQYLKGKEHEIYPWDTI
jgi:hypothetical protein